MGIEHGQLTRQHGICSCAVLPFAGGQPPCKAQKHSSFENKGRRKGRATETSSKTAGRASKVGSKSAGRASKVGSKLAKEASKEQAKQEDWECSSQTTASTAITWASLT